MTRKAIEIIDRQAGRDQPFFLYFPVPAPHTPWLPLPEYRGKSRAGAYGDYVVETDAMIGKVIAALEDKGVLDDTILIFASDNGAYWKERDIDRYPHRANADWRGMKADIWEAGHRVPCIVRNVPPKNPRLSMHSPVLLYSLRSIRRRFLCAAPRYGAMFGKVAFHSQVIELKVYFLA